MEEVISQLIRHIKAAKKDSLEQVQREIDEYKREQAKGIAVQHHDFDATYKPASDEIPEVFVCDGIDETGYGEELVCLCRDPDCKPWTRCPVHDSPID